MVRRAFVLVPIAALVACSDVPSSARSEPPAPPIAAPDAIPGDGGVVSAAPDAAPVAPANGSAGCLREAVRGVTEGVALIAGGRRRTYVLSVPPAYDAAKAYPLVFVFHSGGRSGASARDYFALAGIAESEAVVVYPDGLSGEWDLESPAAENPDVALFDAILVAAEAALCVDAQRVFATGSSMGAYFVNQLGCRRGSKLRAIAPHAGGGPYDVASAYDDEGHLRCAESPVAAMIFHGEKDTSVSLDDGKASRDHWAWANGCKGAPAATEPSPCVAYAGCARPVLWCQIPGGTHRIWADGPKATWQFFKSF